MALSGRTARWSMSFIISTTSWLLAEQSTKALGRVHSHQGPLATTTSQPAIDRGAMIEDG